ncbi:MAG: class I SAM-dependent methyltransferase [Victivallaceae bacterium]|nr:class I SAM-dependent methyltransferase [Victivallaceae bacterium]
MKNKLKGIPETLLIPLWARANETERDDSIVKDYLAVKMVSEIDYDFSKFEKSWLSQLGVSIRTMLLDNATHKFLRKNPGAVVINLGAGLDTRRERLQYDNYKYWYDLDVSDAIELRKKFLKEDSRKKFIAKSMFDYSWMDDIDYWGEPILIIAEGLFMYFAEDELKKLFNKLVSQFPEAEMLFEMLPPIAVGRAKKHESLKTLDNAPEFKWALKKSRDIESWNSQIGFIEEWDYYNYHKKRWKWFAVIAGLPFLRPLLSCRIVHLKFR